MKPKPKAVPKKAPARKAIESDDDEASEVDVQPVAAPPKRTARAAPKKYIEIGSDDDDDGDKDETFEISD